jgi:hypothetical protein
MSAPALPSATLQSTIPTMLSPTKSVPLTTSAPKCMTSFRAESAFLLSPESLQSGLFGWQLALIFDAPMVGACHRLNMSELAWISVPNAATAWALSLATASTHIDPASANVVYVDVADDFVEATLALITPRSTSRESGSTFTQEIASDPSIMVRLAPSIISLENGTSILQGAFVLPLDNIKTGGRFCISLLQSLIPDRSHSHLRRHQHCPPASRAVFFAASGPARRRRVSAAPAHQHGTPHLAGRQPACADPRWQGV